MTSTECERCGREFDTEGKLGGLGPDYCIVCESWLDEVEGEK